MKKFVYMILSVIISLQSATLMNEEPVKKLELKARDALIRYVKDVILNKDNPEGRQIRRAVLDHRSPEDREDAEREILAQAEAFPELLDENRQSQPWLLERSDDPEKPCLYYQGRIFGLAAEIEFDREGENVTRVYIEVD